jgi:hypothetical protein
MNLDTENPAASAARASCALHIPSRVLLLWGTSMAVAGVGVVLLLGELPGLNWTLWTLLAMAGFVFWARRRGRVLGTRRTTMLALACLLVIGAAITGLPPLQIVIAAGVVILAALIIIETGDIQAPASPTRIALAPLTMAVAVLEEARWQASETATLLRANRNLPALRGSLIAAPIVIAFFLLLSAADPTLGSWRSATWSALSSYSFAQRALLFIALGIITLGAYSIAAESPPAPEQITPTTEAPAEVLGSTERLIVLGSLAALFAVFLVLQISYLFGDAGSRAGSGLTYADAAHRGFIELTLTATLSAVLIILLHKLARHDARERLVKYCTLLLIAEVLPMLLSANFRLAHYETAYGYTLLRLYVHVCIALICVAMLLLARQILTSIDLLRLTEQIGVAVVIACSALAFWNHTGWIVDRNLERYTAGRPLDARYLMELAAACPDTTPALVASLRKLDATDVRAQQLRIYLLSDQHGVLDELNARWFRWNLRRVQARQALENLRGASSDTRRVRLAVVASSPEQFIGTSLPVAWQRSVSASPAGAIHLGAGHFIQSTCRSAWSCGTPRASCRRSRSTARSIRCNGPSTTHSGMPTRRVSLSSLSKVGASLLT